MFDILTAIYYDDLHDLRGKRILKPPYTTAENALCECLDTLDPETAKELKQRFRIVAIEQRDKAFLCGTRFGAQLMAELLEGV